MFPRMGQHLDTCQKGGFLWTWIYTTGKLFRSDHPGSWGKSLYRIYLHVAYIY